MKKKLFIQTVALAIALALVGCGNNSTGEVSNNTEVVENVAGADEGTETTEIAEVEEEATEAETVEEQQADLGLEDGCYMVDFDTDNSMFRVNDTMNGKALLTVTEGKGMLHLVLTSKNIVNLYKGVIADVEEHKEDWISPTLEAVTYDDGITEEVNAFDVPVEVIGEEFDLALIGKKQVWYDHKVSISNPESVEMETTTTEAADGNNATATEGKTIEVSLEGGTGKVTLITPTLIKEEAEGYLVTFEWSSKNYDYMIVDEVKYLPVEVNEHSIFEIPVKDISEPLNVIADTVAMSKPHEVEYVITFAVDSMK